MYTCRHCTIAHGASGVESRLVRRHCTIAHEAIGVEGQLLHHALSPQEYAQQAAHDPHAAMVKVHITAGW